MSNRESTRRRFLQVAGTATVVGLAGCAGGDGGGEETTTTTEATTTTAAETTAQEMESVPEAYQGAVSLGGTERNPDALSTKEAVQYQEEPKDGNQCSGCTFYIEDKNDDGLGACAIVEGTIDPQGYCISYSAYEGS